MTREALTASSAERSGRLFLYVGLGLGVLAAILVAVVLSKANSKDTSAPATAAVVVAAQDISSGEPITADMLMISIVDAREASNGSFASVSQVANGIAGQDIASGTTITSSMVGTARGRGLTLAIEPGMRGFSIEVAQGTSVGGNISVGDYVDVLVLLDTAPVEGSSTVPDLASISRDLVGNPDLPEPLVVNSQNGAATLAVTVVQNVKVLALDQTVSSQGSTGSSQSSSASAAGKEPNANTATLELTPQDVQTLALVSKYGSLLLSLRSFGDDAKEPVAPIAAGF